MTACFSDVSATGRQTGGSDMATEQRRATEQELAEASTTIADFERILRKAHASGYAIGLAIGKAEAIAEMKRSRVEWAILTAAWAAIIGLVAGMVAP